MNEVSGQMRKSHTAQPEQTAPQAATGSSASSSSSPLPVVSTPTATVVAHAPNYSDIIYHAQSLVSAVSMAHSTVLLTSNAVSSSVPDGHQATHPQRKPPNFAALDSLQFSWDEIHNEVESLLASRNINKIDPPFLAYHYMRVQNDTSRFIRALARIIQIRKEQSATAFTWFVNNVRPSIRIRLLQSDSIKITHGNS